ncbi:MAG TPA: ADP-forming succinate--CoA ligase subunit beta [Chloroflexota bacterium]|jgi:succinyl-CoA synthetase beta subunit|nr:ADP-forming succinate--CoA ligase subunit beta [Chloroflexota bacterium]
MKLQEYMAKNLLRNSGVAVPEGEVADSPEAVRQIAREIGCPVAVKAQVLVGGRGKAGGIKVAATAEAAFEAAETIIGMDIKGLTVQKVLVEKGIDIGSEYYAALAVDRSRGCTVLMLSSLGGIDIEEVAHDHPEAIIKVPIDPAYGLLPFQVSAAMFRAGFDGPIRDLGKIVSGLARVAVESDAVLAEVNPLVVTTDGQALAADCKVDIDDSALYRHPELAPYKDETAEDPIELYAARQDLPYVRLDGDIGIIGNGAGLVMMTLDIVRQVGGVPANFLDIGGGAKAEVVRKAIEVVLMDDKVRGIVMNIFGGITRGDEVAKGLLEAASSMDIKVPIAIRLAGTRAEEGRALLEGSSFTPAADVATATRAVMFAVGQGGRAA